MFDFLSRGRNKADRADHGPSTMPQTVQTNSTQRDMARLTLHHILKHHGIPAHWIAGELIPIRIPGDGEAVLLQLEIMHWHDSLVLHAPALQEELLQGLRRFDPATNGTRYLFTWKFSPDCGCPHTQLPEPGFWTGAPAVAPMPAPTHTAAAAPVAAAAVASAAPLPPGPLDASKIPFDLPDQPALDDDDDNHGFAPTQIHSIRD
jgi:hypothetical protein